DVAAQETAERSFGRAAGLHNKRIKEVSVLRLAARAEQEAVEIQTRGRCLRVANPGTKFARVKLAGQLTDFPVIGFGKLQKGIIGNRRVFVIQEIEIVEQGVGRLALIQRSYPFQVIQKVGGLDRNGSIGIQPAIEDIAKDSILRRILRVAGDIAWQLHHGSPAQEGMVLQNNLDVEFC